MRGHHRYVMRLVALIALWGSAAGAQSVRIQVVEASSGAPVPGALISLAPVGGRFGDERMADERATRTFAVPTSGDYTVRVRRIGFAASTHQVSLTAQPETQTVVVSVVPIPTVLPAVAVTTTGCPRRERDAEQLAVVHDEVSKSLVSTKLSIQQRRELATALKFRRQLTVDGRVHGGDSTYVRVNAARPYTAPSARLLLRDGFVVRDDDGWRFFGPDPELLLSDQFLRTHCFYLTRGTGRHAGRIGLSFEPVRGRRDPGIAGTLWVDRATSELREAEYRYVNLPREIHSPEAGGHLRFARLSSGPWRIEEWVIRMPVVALRPPDNWTVVGFTEEGARLMSAPAAELPKL